MCRVGGVWWGGIAQKIKDATVVFGVGWGGGTLYYFDTVGSLNSTRKNFYHLQQHSSLYASDTTARTEDLYYDYFGPFSFIRLTFERYEGHNFRFKSNERLLRATD